MELIATPKAILKPTREQKLIISHLPGHAMVTASPGCAEISTLTLRVMHMHYDVIQRQVIKVASENAVIKAEPDYAKTTLWD